MGREDDSMKRRCNDCGIELPVGCSSRRQRCEECAKKRKREYGRKYMREHNSRPEVKERRREHNARPEIKERNRKYAREYRTRPEVKERLREYHARPEVKERKREYASQAEVKERKREHMKEYTARPEVKERRRNRTREYNTRPEVKKRHADQVRKRRNCVLPSDLIQEFLPGDWVYVLRVEGDDESPVKIGRSSKLLQRLRKHQRDNFCALSLVALIPGDLELEFVLHRLLGEYRLNRYGIEEREMFTPSPEVLRAVGILAEAFPYPRPGLTEPQTLLSPARVLALLEEIDSSDLQAAE